MHPDSESCSTRSLVESASVRLSVREFGDPADPTIVLVHGYPDNSSVWDGVVAALSGQPWHLVTYDVRGMGASRAPDEPAAYGLEHLAADLAAVVRAVSPDAPVHLVGHDWGSIQAWEAVSDPRYHHLFASYTSMSGPCLDHLRDWRRRNRTPRGVLRQLDQAAHSAYIGLFRLPRVPELLWRNSLLRSRFGADLNDAVRGLQLYRVNMGGRAPRPRATPVPVQQIAPTRDRYVLPALLTSADPWCERLWRRLLPAGHWAPRSHPDVVARWVVEFVRYLGDPAANPSVPLERARVR